MPEVKNVHILMMGRDPGHAKIGLQKLECDVVHIITSEELAEEIDHKSMMDEWASDLGIKPGEIHTIPNSELFSAEATGKVVAAVLSIIRQETHRPLMHLGGVREQGVHVDPPTRRKADDVHCFFFIGFTGGTNLMAGAAVHAANLFSASPYYVARVPDGNPDEGEPVVLAPMNATALLSAAPNEAIIDLLEHPKGRLLSLDNIETHILINRLDHLNLASVGRLENAELDISSRWVYDVSEEGILLLEIMAERRRLTEPPEQQGRDAEDEGAAEEEGSAEEVDGPPDSSDPKMGDLTDTLLTVTREQVPADKEMLAVLMERWNLEGRAEVWQRDDERTLRIHFVNTEDESSKPNLHQWKEVKFEVENDLLVKEILKKLPSNMFGMRDAQHAEASRIISGDTEFELMLLLAKLIFERLGFSFGPSPRGSSGWGRTGKKRP
jgi:hypothetical protein